MKRKMEDGDVGDDGGADRLHKVMVMAMMATSSTPNPKRLSYQESKHNLHNLNCNLLILRTLTQGTSTWLKPIHANTSELSKLTLGCERPQTMQILNDWYPLGSLFLI